jgi:hypothetical protein
MYEVKIQPHKIEYSPKKIDEFVETATKVLQNGKDLLYKYKNTILSIVLSDVVNNIEKYKTLHSEMSNDHDKLEKIHNKFFDVVDRYEFFDRPDNVRELDDLVTDIDRVTLDMYYLTYALDNIMEAGENLNKQYFNK